MLPATKFLAIGAVLLALYWVIFRWASFVYQMAVVTNVRRVAFLGVRTLGVSRCRLDLPRLGRLAPLYTRVWIHGQRGVVAHVRYNHRVRLGLACTATS